MAVFPYIKKQNAGSMCPIYIKIASSIRTAAFFRAGSEYRVIPFGISLNSSSLLSIGRDGSWKTRATLGDIDETDTGLRDPSGKSKAHTFKGLVSPLDGRRSCIGPGADL